MLDTKKKALPAIQHSSAMVDSADSLHHRLPAGESEPSYTELEF